MTGERLRLGGKHGGDGGLDLLSVVAGCEGRLGVVTEATLRILPRPPATRTLLIGFASVRAAAETVAAIIAQGIIPAALEFMDRACIAVVEAFCAPGYPKDAEAILIIEVDGMPAEVAEDARPTPEIPPPLAASAVHASANK